MKEREKRETYTIGSAAEDINKIDTGHYHGINYRAR